MKKTGYFLLALLILTLSVALVACNNAAPVVNGGQGGETGGETDGETGSETDDEQPYSQDMPEYYIFNLQKYGISPVLFPDEYASMLNAEWLMTTDISEADVIGEMLSVICYVDEETAAEQEESLKGNAETVLRNGTIVAAGTRWVVETAVYGKSQAQREASLGANFYDIMKELREKKYSGHEIEVNAEVFGDIELRQIEFDKFQEQIEVLVIGDENDVAAAISAYEENVGKSHYRATKGNVIVISDTEQGIADALGEDVVPFRYEEQKDTSFYAIEQYYLNIAQVFDSYNITENTYLSAFDVVASEYAFGSKTDAAETVRVFIADSLDANAVEEKAALYGLTAESVGDGVFIVGTPWAVSVAKGERNDALLDQLLKDIGVYELADLNRDEKFLVQYGVNDALLEIYIGDGIVIEIYQDEQYAEETIGEYLASDNCVYAYVLQKGEMLIKLADGQYKDSVSGEGITIYDVFSLRAQEWVLNGYQEIGTYFERLRQAGERAEVKSYSAANGVTVLSVSDYKEGFTAAGKETLFVRAYATEADAQAAASQAVSILCVGTDGKLLLEGTPWAISVAKGENPTAEKGDYVESLDLEGLRLFADDRVASMGYDNVYVSAGGGSYENATAQYTVNIFPTGYQYTGYFVGATVVEFADEESAQAFAKGNIEYTALGEVYVFVTGRFAIVADMYYRAATFDILSEMPGVVIYYKQS